MRKLTGSMVTVFEYLATGIAPRDMARGRYYALSFAGLMRRGLVATSPNGAVLTEDGKRLRDEMFPAPTDTHVLAIAQNLGHDAYHNGGMRAPVLSVGIMDLITDKPVGTGSADIFRAFTNGFDRAVDAECARLLDTVCNIAK